MPVAETRARDAQLLNESTDPEMFPWLGRFPEEGFCRLKRLYFITNVVTSESVIRVNEYGYRGEQNES